MKKTIFVSLVVFVVAAASFGWAYAAAAQRQDIGAKCNQAVDWAVQRVEAHPRIAAPVATVIGSIVGVLLLIFIVKRLAVSLQRARHRRRLAKVRLASLNHDVIREADAIDNNAALYPEARKLRVVVELVTDRSGPTGALNVVLSLVRPDGANAQRFTQPAQPSQFHRLLAVFEIDDVNDLRACPGTWRLDAVLEPSHRLLGSTRLRVVDTSAMIDDLEVADLRFVHDAGAIPDASSIVLTTARSIAISGIVRPRTLDARRFPDLSAVLLFVRNEEVRLAFQETVPVRFVNGVAILPERSVPLGTGRLAGMTGNWRVLLVIGHRTLQAIDFTLVSPQEILGNLRVESFELAGTRGTTMVSMVQSSASLTSIDTIVPVAVIANPFPTPLLGFRITAGVCVGSEVLGYTDQHFSLPNARNQVVMGELSLNDPRLVGSCTFFLFVNDRLLAQRELKLGPRLPSVTDVQGRLSRTATTAPVDADAESERILAEATVVNP